MGTTSSGNDDVNTGLIIGIAAAVLIATVIVIIIIIFIIYRSYRRGT